MIRSGKKLRKGLWFGDVDSMNEQKKEISIIIPVCNEEESIALLVNEITAQLNEKLKLTHCALSGTFKIAVKAQL